MPEQPVSSGRAHKSRLRVRLLSALGIIAAAVLPLATTSHAAASSSTTYYLSLGDSLARGVQPDSTGTDVLTNHGYVNDLYAAERHNFPGLRMAQLGCPGETTHTMIVGGICSYHTGGQLAQAVSFLHSHTVAFITIDIGANNVNSCVSGDNVNTNCIIAGIQQAISDLPQILQTLRTVAPAVPIYAMNYYDPFLAAWLQGSAGQTLAHESEAIATEFNGYLTNIYTAFGVPVADVAGAFQTSNFTLTGVGVPVNVLLICAFTWMCEPPPVGPNIHADVVGYEVIAIAFTKVI